MPDTEWDLKGLKDTKGVLVKENRNLYSNLQMASGGTVEDSLGSTCQSASTTSIQREKVAGLHPTMKQRGGWGA